MERWIRAKYQPCIPLGDNNSRITESKAHINLSRRAASDGAVLLKNQNSLLPFDNGQKIAIFGKAQIDYVKGGGGSGDVMVSYVRNIYEGLKMKGNKIEILDNLSFYYSDYVNKKYANGEKCGMLDEPDIPDNLINEAKQFTDTALITINRYSREGEDRKNDGIDSYFTLSDNEQKMINVVCSNFRHIVVLLNVGAMIDTSWFSDNDNIEAALMLWQGGMEGGLAAADLLVGDAVPSGKLVDTCARNFNDYPSSKTFHESDDYVKYTEDIFVGYRYFETIPNKKECVVYPFGYGLSYTSFEMFNISVCDDGNRIFVNLSIKNIGKYPGREVVQLYYLPPEGRITKPKIELCAFKKTPLLEPDEICDITLSFKISDMASYDDTGIIEKSAYVLEKGEYRLAVGNSVRNTRQPEYTYKLCEDTVVQKLTQLCAPQVLGKRMNSDGTFTPVPDRNTTPPEYECDYICPLNIPEATENIKPLEAVVNGEISLDEFVSQLSDDELMVLLAGRPNKGVTRTNGIGDLEKFGIPPIMTADGPAGVHIRMVNTTAFPIATALACTWDTDLLKEIGIAGAVEVKENNMQIWLTPALNIHRSPLCGRNFEYYSEDPLVSGKMAAAMVKGIQSQGIIAVPKHFACNNKETNRFSSDSVLSERALREIYLKGFEICVKESSPKMIMSSYNVINGIRASENAELLTGILRNEWGFKGMITTDWNNTSQHYKEIKAGSDVRMPALQQGKLKEPYEKGLITRNEMALCVKRILEMILWLE